MSEVYLGEQVSLGRKVALKVLNRKLNQQPGMAERFRREARLLSTVEHPAVVRVIDYGDAGESACLVLELMEGEGLNEVLRQGPLEPTRAVRLLHQLAEGLAAIHSKGIIHRDLKPENVLVVQGARGEQARLLDFGIARLVDTDVGTPISQAGIIMGTPEYLSPEQALGAALDARSDLYSLGVLAYRMLAGHLPLPGPQPHHFISQHITHAPEPLDQARPELARLPALVALVMSLLEKEPQKRPASAEALLEALGGVALRMGCLPTHVLFVPGGAGAASSRRRLSGVRRVLSGWRRPMRRLRASRRWRLVASLGVVALAALGVARWEQAHDPLLQARGLVAEGHPLVALERLEQVPEYVLGRPSWRRARALALHALGWHEEEHAAMAELDSQGLAGTEGEVLDGLAEDFGNDESSPRLRRLLSAFPTQQLHEHFQALACQPHSPRQWGALRYLESVSHTQALELTRLYTLALESPRCEVRAKAAQRLAALKEPGAVPALERLRRLLNKERGPGAARDCGQDEAFKALQALRQSG